MTEEIVINKEELMKQLLTLGSIKRKLFKDFLYDIKYLKIYTETGEYPNYYKEVMDLKEIIDFFCEKLNAQKLENLEKYGNEE